VPAYEMALPTAETYAVRWVTPFLSSAAVLKTLLGESIGEISAEY